MNLGCIHSFFSLSPGLQYCNNFIEAHVVRSPVHHFFNISNESELSSSPIYYKTYCIQFVHTKDGEIGWPYHWTKICPIASTISWPIKYLNLKTYMYSQFSDFELNANTYIYMLFNESWALCIVNDARG